MHRLMQLSALLASVGVLGGVLFKQGERPLRSFDRPAAAPATLGYLTAKELPDSLAILPPPPTEHSSEIIQDEAARQNALRARGTARYEQAASDAVVAFSSTPESFSCAIGFDVNKAKTPHLYRLMTTMVIDVRFATSLAKDHYKRTRPFLVHGSSTCSERDRGLVRNEGSYPSWQSALGWAYALVLADMLPSRAGVIRERGRQFGQSRVICDAQWQSDVDAGRVMGAATVERLARNAAFRADFAKARLEAASASQGTEPAKPCTDTIGVGTVPAIAR